MTELHAVPQNQSSFADVAKELWSYLTDRGAAINYEFEDMSVEVPRETGANSERAVWKLNGTLRITTSDVPTAA